MEGPENPAGALPTPDAEDFEQTTVSQRLKESSLNLKEQVRQWIEELLGVLLPGNLMEHLRSGVLLCQCVNKLFPGTIKRINESDKQLAFHQMENINKFLSACITLGLPRNQLFTTIDLYESKDSRLVFSTVAELSSLALQRIPDYAGPVVLRGTGSSPAMKRKVVIKTRPAPASPFSQRQYTAPRHSSPLASPPETPADVVSSSRNTSLYDPYLARAACDWIRAVIEWDETQANEEDLMNDIEICDDRTLDSDQFHATLQDGILLCEMLNRLVSPPLVPQIHRDVGKKAFKYRENVELYLAGCRTFGLPSMNCFSTNDLMEEKNLPLVVSNIHSLSSLVRKEVQRDHLHWRGPLIGLVTRKSQRAHLSILERVESDNQVSRGKKKAEEEKLIDSSPIPPAETVSSVDEVIELSDSPSEVPESATQLAAVELTADPSPEMAGESEQPSEEVPTATEQADEVETDVPDASTPSEDTTVVLPSEEPTCAEPVEETAEEPQSTSEDVPEVESLPAVESLPNIETLPDVAPALNRPADTVQPPSSKPTPTAEKAASPARPSSGAWGWFSSVFSDASNEADQPVVVVPAEEEPSSTRSFFGSLSSAISEMVAPSPPTQRRAASPPQAPTPVKGKLRGFAANFDRHMGSVRLQALEMISQEMTERMEDMDVEDNGSLREIQKQIEEALQAPILPDALLEIPPEVEAPYLSEVAKLQSKQLYDYEERRNQAIQELKATFSRERTTDKTVIQHTNTSLHTTHDRGQEIMTEIASLAVEMTMRIGESYLIEPFLPEEESVAPPAHLTKHTQQALYARYMLLVTAYEAKQIYEEFVNFTYRVGTAGKVRVIRCCNDRDVEQFGKAIDAMTSAAVAKHEADFQNVLKHINHCQTLLQPLLVYLTLSGQ